MHSRFSRHQTRHIASVMLFVWLFAMVASWANACILQPSGAVATLHGHHERGNLAAHHDFDHASAAGTSAAHETDPAQEACASFCDTEQSIVAKAQPAKGEGPTEQASCPAQVFASWPAVLPDRADVRWRPVAAPLPPGPPVVIALLRLTI
jgi:hypothetical protein